MIRIQRLVARRNHANKTRCYARIINQSKRYYVIRQCPTFLPPKRWKKTTISELPHFLTNLRHSLTTSTKVK